MVDEGVDKEKGERRMECGVGYVRTDDFGSNQFVDVFYGFVDSFSVMSFICFGVLLFCCLWCGYSVWACVERRE